MDPKIIVAIIIAVLVVIGIVLALIRKRQGDRLKQHFGPEYDRQLRAAGGSRSKAEAELLRREKRVGKLDIRPLDANEREAFFADWQEVQAEFVDDPERSIAKADALVAEVMKARGYPVDDFEQRAQDISVEHPELVENYRSAHAIAERRAQGKADTDDLRAAFIGYRSLFDHLLKSDPHESSD